ATPLYPSASFFNTYTHASTTVYPGTIEKLQSIVSANQAALASRKAAAAAAASSASGSSSSASSAASSSSGTASSTSSNIANAGVFGGATNTFQSGFSMGWSLPNMGLGIAANIMSARALSRQAMLQANQELLLVDQQVRSDYLTAITSRAQIDSTAFGVASAKEALRLALMRLQTGTGTNLELIQAQRDYITALTSQAQAIAASNSAQAQLLHDTGLISIETLTRGYHSSAPIKDKRIQP
ncbi:MAG: TolC family protein, partial [Candidatus Obscuribacterales bacterium]|nr:TolC family protein [Candidatus Obscuribacterales bacterium]